jgi:dolichol-phosphate mannosyltransferase
MVAQLEITPQSNRRLLSIICPVYNEELNVPLFYQQATDVLAQLGQYDCEIIFTNNSSVDRTYDIIVELQKHDPRVKLFTLSRNFGYQASVLCGLTHASGDASVVIDVDCEDPPEMVAAFVKQWEAGYDIIFGIRNQRPEPQIIQFMRHMFYWLLQKMGDNDVIMHMAEFALISKRVREAIIQNNSTFPFLRTEIGYAGFSRIGIPYMRRPRTYGTTHYNFFTMTVFAVGGILSSSTFLLRFAAYSGAILMLINIILLLMDLTSLWNKAFNVLVALSLMYIVFFVAVLSVYQARIYKNGVGRPVFIVDWKRSIFEREHSANMEHQTKL